jgi:hypothetical protein
MPLTASSPDASVSATLRVLEVTPLASVLIALAVYAAFLGWAAWVTTTLSVLGGTLPAVLMAGAVCTWVIVSAARFIPRGPYRADAVLDFRQMLDRPADSALCAATLVAIAAVTASLGWLSERKDRAVS